MSISEMVRNEVTEVEEQVIEVPKIKKFATVEDIPSLSWYEKIAAGGLALGAGALSLGASLGFINYTRTENPALFLIPAAVTALYLAGGVDYKKTGKNGNISEKDNNNLPPV